MERADNTAVARKVVEGGMGTAAIEVRGLRKSYGTVEAVRGVDLSVGEGEVFALLGPNGAGKTTTVEILEGFRTRDAGEVQVLGCDPADQTLELKTQIGIVLQSTGVDPYLTVRETIDMFAASYPSPRPTEEVIEVVGLTDKRDARVTNLSGGSSAGWTSRSRWPVTRACCSSTSPPPGSTLARGATPGRWCATYRPSARRSC